ncbi:MAG: methionine--tRNA ligase [Nanoarchaeota archaeon]
MKRILVTAALPYANGPIHIGHLVEYIQSDIFVRFLKLSGKHAVFCCADDTHGAPIEINARKQGISPEQLIAKYFDEHRRDFKDFLIAFDSYYSTNSTENKEYADYFFEQAKKKGLIYTKEIEHAFCEKDQRFLPDRFVKGTCPKCGAADQYGDVCEKCNAAYNTIDLIEPYCTICGSPPVRKKSTHYFFKLSSMAAALDTWLVENKRLQKEIVNSVRNWIKEGLKDWDISRDGPYFGFKIPGEENKFYYVWLDAPIGYIASTAHYCEHHGGDALDYWKHKDGEVIHFIGKDIIYFHYLFWPALLTAADYSLPTNIITHGHLTVNGEKMSKSRGTFLTARDYLDRANPELLRFYFATNLSWHMADINLDEKDFKDKVNTELVGNVMNFAYRVLSFADRNFEGQIVPVGESAFTNELEAMHDRIQRQYERCDLREAMKLILHYSSLGNKHFQEKEPWKLIKENREQAQEVVSRCVNIVKNLCVLLKPVLPKVAAELEVQLNIKEQKWPDLNFSMGKHKISHAKILLIKLDDKALFAVRSPFSALNIKVAKVLTVEDHPNAEKLYVLRIDLGAEQRTLVAGLKGYVAREDLLGRNICALTNLEPAKLRGVESQGMLLAAESGSVVKPLEAPNSKPGDQVMVEGIAPGERQITFKEFQEIALLVKDRKAEFDGTQLKTATEPISCDIADGARVR